MMKRYVGALDQGTTSTRFMVFDRAGGKSRATRSSTSRSCRSPAGSSTIPLEIAARTNESIAGALQQRRPDGGRSRRDRRHQSARDDGRLESEDRTALVQRDRLAGHAHRSHRQRARRAGRRQLIRERTGLPPATYFSGAKLQWILENVDGVRAAADRGEAVFGTIDTLGDLEPDRRPRRRRARHRRHQCQPHDADGPADAQWDDELLELFGVPREMLPAIRSSSDPAFYGADAAHGPVGGEVPICGDLGDQQAATVGQVCSRRARRRTPTAPATSCCSTPARRSCRRRAGLLTTVCYQMGADEPIYALEGSIAVTGSAVQWLRDQLGIISAASEIEALADVGARQRRRLLRSGVLGTVRAVLAIGCARRDRRPVALQHQGPSRARDARGDLFPDARRARRDGGGLRRAARGAEGRWRRDRQRHADAAAGRHPRRSRRSAGRRRDDGARRRVRRRAWRPASGTASRICVRTGSAIGSGSRAGAPISAKAATPGGRKRCRGRWTG